jgi:hypothetical protein
MSPARVHIFRAYAESVDDFELVEVPADLSPDETLDQASHYGAMYLGCLRHHVIVRYVVTRYRPAVARKERVA